jgi:hypothetical protein
MKKYKGYEEFVRVLEDALERTAAGKGRERHGDGKPFLDQDMMIECRYQNGPYFPVSQVRKKAKESLRLRPEQAYEEMLDVIVYAVGAALWHSGVIEGTERVEEFFDLKSQKPVGVTLGELREEGLWPKDKEFEDKLAVDRVQEYNRVILKEGAINYPSAKEVHTDHDD